MMSLLEKKFITYLPIVFVSALGLARFYSTQYEKEKKEIRLLRIIGASPPFIFALVERKIWSSQ